MTQVANKSYDDYSNYTVTVDGHAYTDVNAPSRFCAMDVVIDFAHLDVDRLGSYHFLVAPGVVS